jgi:hypothetical protein
MYNHKMINIKKITAISVVAIAALATQNIEVHAQRVNSILCIDEDSAG